MESNRSCAASVFERDRPASPAALLPATPLPATATPEPTYGPLVGQKVAHYRVLGILGGGGMGVVYKGEDLKLNRPVALKFLPEETSTDAAARRRFEYEAKTASSLNHPNICTIHQVEEHGGHPFIVMEFLEGETLRELIARRRSTAGTHRQEVSLRQVVEIAIQILEGLEAAHAKDIIHRDIKPANIFMTNGGQIKILDFGLAKISATQLAITGTAVEDENAAADAAKSVGSEVSSTYSRPGAAIGTAGYMSPEQIRGEKLDARTDLFSFGLVLFEMTTCRRPFGGTQGTDQDSILYQELPSARDMNAEIPVALERLMRKLLEKDRQNRYASATETLNAVRGVADEMDVVSDVDSTAVRKHETHGRRNRSGRWLTLAAVVILLIALSVLMYRRHRRAAFMISPQETLVLADFENSTGDAVFDDALRQGLFVGLEQSPRIRILSGRRLDVILDQMRHSGNERVTGKVALELCQRAEGKVMVQGLISQLGTTYSLGLTAVDCDNGESIAHEQSIARNKNEIIGALGKITTRLRARLGESPPSIERFNTPLEQATTTSMEALKTYSIALQTADKEAATAIPIYQRAIELDPDFAMAYGSIAESFDNNGQSALAGVYAAKAFALRERVTEYERLSIGGWYYLYTTRDLRKAQEVLELLVHDYPQTPRSLNDLGAVYGNLGLLEKGAAAFHESLRLDPTFLITRANLIVTLMTLDRMSEAEALRREAELEKLHSTFFLAAEYWRSFLLRDIEGRKLALSQSRDFPDSYATMLEMESNTQAFYGHFAEARRLSAKAEALMEHDDGKESAAGCWAEAAIREIEVGELRNGQEYIARAMRLDHSRAVLTLGALAKAKDGDSRETLKIIERLNHDYPSDTMVQEYWLPTIRAELALQNGQPSKAIELLASAESIERGTPEEFEINVLYPAYVRGEAYLALNDGRSAQVEFQKLTDHPGMGMNFPLGALALLGSARAYDLEGNSAKSRNRYKEFLQLWKDADPDIPILQKAKAEYAKMQGILPN